MQCAYFDLGKKAAGERKEGIVFIDFQLNFIKVIYERIHLSIGIDIFFYEQC